MKKRITFMLDDSIANNIHKEQSRRILKTNKNVSFSELIEEQLGKKYGVSN